MNKSADGRDRFTNVRSWVSRRILVSLPPRLAAHFEDADYAVGIGPSVGGGVLLGGSLGGGVLVHRGGIGYYGSIGLGAGILAGLSAGVHVTVVRGGADAFLGLARAVAATVVYTGVMLLYTREHRLLGASVAASVGSGLPFELYAGLVKTYGRARFSTG